MKIKILQPRYSNYWRYNLNEWNYIPEEFDYVFKYLDFDKLDKNEHITFNDNKIKKWFFKIYINIRWLEDIYNKSPEGYKWLKENWGNGVFKLDIYYPDKQKLKTIVNKVINIELINR